MPFADIGCFPLWPITHSNVFSSAVTLVNIAASTHWVGGHFFASRTGTITAIRFSTGTVTSPVFDLEGAITALDANGYPLGTDVAASSTVISGAAITATTDFSVTISASVTAGTMYGIIVRVKSGTYTSGSANVAQLTSAWWPAVAGAGGYPCASKNVGSNTKAYGACAIMPKYSDGWFQNEGIGLYAAGGFSGHSLAATSGHSVGNRFVLTAPIKVWGYLVGADHDNPANLEMYAGSDNTAITGSNVALQAAYRQTNGNVGSVAYLAAPITLNPGTYRVGLRNTSAAANTLRQLASIPEAGMQAVLCNGLASVYKTVYTSSWADTDTAICCIAPIVSAVDAGAPRPSLNIGGLD